MRAGIMASALRPPVPPELVFDGVLSANDDAVWSESITLTHTGHLVLMPIWFSPGGDWLTSLAIDGQSATWHITGVSESYGVSLASLAMPSSSTVLIEVGERNSRMDTRVGVWSSPVPLAFRDGTASPRETLASRSVVVGSHPGDFIVAGVSTRTGSPALSGDVRHSETRMAFSDLTAVGGDTITATIPAAEPGRIIAAAFHAL